MAGAPAAAALSDNRTELLVGSKAGSLLATNGSGTTPTGTWQPWRMVSSAGPIKPDVALAIGTDGTMAAYVIRSPDLAIMRLMNTGYWSYAFPTGAVGQPEAAYTNSGKPYLFIQSVSGDVQVYEPSGADLHGSMSWVPAGVTSQNPVGVTPLPGRPRHDHHRPGRRHPPLPQHALSQCCLNAAPTSRTLEDCGPRRT